MVDRYKASTGVSAAPIAKPQSSGLAEIASGVRQVANTALDVATKKVAERTASLEAAALNSARLELEKRGAQLAVDLQKDRVAGSDYVKDLERERQKLKTEIWSTVPKRIQSSASALSTWDDVWTSSEISSTRSAVAYQAEQEKNFAKRSLDDGLAAMAATVEVDPDSAARHLEQWTAGVPTYSGLLDQEALADAQSKGTQVILQGAVRGLSKQGRFDEAEKLVTQAAGKLDPQQRQAFESVIEGAKNDIEQERAKKDKERNEAWQLNDANFQVSVMQGQKSYADIDAGIKDGSLDPKRRDILYRAVRAEGDRRKAEAENAKLTAAERKLQEERSEDFKLVFDAFSTMDPARFMAGPDEWTNSMRDKFALMTPADQRYIERKQFEMAQAGQTTTVVKSVYTHLTDEAKRVVPDWDVGSTAENAPNEGQEFAGRLYQVAERVAAENGGKDLTVDQARSAVARALDAYQPGKWDTLPSNIYDNEADKVNARLKSAVDPNYDYRAEELIREQFRATLNRSPTDAELREAYAAVKGGGN